jgi:hypothetical protein
MSDEHLVVVHSFATEMEAVIAKSALESAGIISLIRSDSAGGMRPHLGWSTGGFEVLVRQEDKGAAREVVQLPHEWAAFSSIVDWTKRTSKSKARDARGHRVAAVPWLPLSR